jgi:hypothetical protein
MDEDTAVKQGELSGWGKTFPCIQPPNQEEV